MPLRQPTKLLTPCFQNRQKTRPYPHIVEFDKAFIVPLTRGNRLDIAKLLEFATNFVVIDGLARSRIPQRDDQGTLGI